MTIKFKTISILLLYNLGFSQSNLTSSPYSIFGLGKINDSNIGITNSLGKSGIALFSEYELNGLNPASLGSIKLNNFFFDIGLKSEFNSFGDKSSSSNEPTLGFSNISLGFPLNEKSGISLSLIPYTEVGYQFQGIVQNIGGSTDTYESTINGNGGLNAININYGRKINSKLNAGISAKYLFGSIKQTETVILENDFLIIEDQNYYKGFSIGTGIQYQLTEKLNIASVFNLQSNIKGTKDRLVEKIIDQQQTIIEDSKDISIKNYKNPSEISFGIKYDYKNYSFVSDYKRSFWSALNQKDDIGDYVDSNIFGIGIERFNKSPLYGKRTLRYRIGYNYDDGNLRVNNNKIATSTYTAGVSIPIGINRKSYFNISYSYGSRGVVSNILVKENYHTLTFNFDFADNWFIKRKFD